MSEAHGAGINICIDKLALNGWCCQYCKDKLITFTPRLSQGVPPSTQFRSGELGSPGWLNVLIFWPDAELNQQPDLVIQAAVKRVSHRVPGLTCDRGKWLHATNYYTDGYTPLTFTHMLSKHLNIIRRQFKKKCSICTGSLFVTKCNAHKQLSLKRLNCWHKQHGLNK